MSALRDAVEEYLALRRALGAPILTAGSQLRGFVEFLECEGADFVTTQFALRWARQSTHAQPATWADRLGVVRRFAEWRSLTDPRTESCCRTVVGESHHTYTATKRLSASSLKLLNCHRPLGCEGRPSQHSLDCLPRAACGSAKRLPLNWPTWISTAASWPFARRSLGNRASSRFMTPRDSRSRTMRRFVTPSFHDDLSMRSS